MNRTRAPMWLNVAIASPLLVLAAFAGASVWHGLWFNHGFIGATGVLRYLLSADGEKAYDAEFDEMAIILFLVLSAAYVAVLLLRKRQARTHGPA